MAGTSRYAEWTSTSYALVAAFLSFLEPDPDVEWDAEHVTATIAAFEELSEVIQSARRPQ